MGVKFISWYRWRHAIMYQLSPAVPINEDIMFSNVGRDFKNRGARD